MEQSNKFLNIVGEVVKRINNPEQTAKSGNKYRLNYLVIKWVSGKAGSEFVDYVPIKIMEYKKIADLRVGYIVNVPVMYSCSIRTNEVEYRTTNVQGTMIERPSLWPEFVLLKSKEIEVINSDNNKEALDQTNQQFENNVISPPEGVDDLPF